MTTTPPNKPSSLVKPTQNTKFHIDYEWWERSTEDLRIYLISHLPPEARDRLTQDHEERVVDFVDPDTGEVFQFDELQLAIQLAAQSADFINQQTSLVDSVFRVFLKNNNKPLSPKELSKITGRQAEVILKTLSGTRIYKGIRPYLK